MAGRPFELGVRRLRGTVLEAVLQNLRRQRRGRLLAGVLTADDFSAAYYFGR